MLATVGTLGDLHPFIAIALALKAAGIEPLLACAEEYAPKVAAAGIPWHPLRPSVGELERSLGLTRAELTQRAIRRNDFLFRRLVLPYLRVAYDDMLAALDGAALLLPSTLAFGARLAAEQRGIPWLAVALQPLVFLSAYDPPLLPQGQWAGRLLRAAGPTLARPALRLLKLGLEPMFEPVRRLRREVGLPGRSAHPLFEGQYGPAGAVALYSAVLGGVQPDYPAPTAIVGFASFDSESGRRAHLDPALAKFLEGGDAPLVFTLGSLICSSPGDFFSESLAAARALGRRALLLVGTEGLARWSALSGSDALIWGYAPYSLVLPYAAAVIHQGGIGTLGQALRAGRVQLIVPYFADQMDNAERARRAGVARVLAPARYRAVRVAAELSELLADPRAASRATALQGVIAAEDGAGATARRVSALLG